MATKESLSEDVKTLGWGLWMLISSPVVVFLAALFAFLWGMTIAFDKSYEPLVFGSALLEGASLAVGGALVFIILIAIGHAKARK